MGENEQGGMLRTVVVVGLVAMVALIITLGVVGLKASMTKNTDKGVSFTATATKPYSVKNPEVTYKSYSPSTSTSDQITYGYNSFDFPLAGDIPTNSWREDVLTVTSTKRTYVLVDVNNMVAGSASNDNDDKPQRSIALYDEAGNQLSFTHDMYGKTWLDANKVYRIVVKYFNKSGKPMIGGTTPRIGTGTEDGSGYTFKILSFEAATYDDKYNK